MKKEIKNNASQSTGINVPTDCCQGGYGYMKRRHGLLSFEVDKRKEQKKNASKE